ncbi:hypothetical protein D1872_261720 [compost metagenome]
MNWYVFTVAVVTCVGIISLIITVFAGASAAADGEVYGWRKARVPTIVTCVSAAIFILCVATLFGLIEVSQ